MVVFARWENWTMGRLNRLPSFKQWKKGWNSDTNTLAPSRICTPYHANTASPKYPLLIIIIYTPISSNCASLKIFCLHYPLKRKGIFLIRDSIGRKREASDFLKVPASTSFSRLGFLSNKNCVVITEPL